MPRNDVIRTTTETGRQLDRLDETVSRLMRQRSIPGLSLAVVNRDRLLYAAGFGTADLSTSAPATAQTGYLWFSMSKLVTATATMALADAGALDLDAPIGDIDPALVAPGNEQPTVRQLLNHTAGLANPLPLRWVHAAEKSAPDSEAMLRRLLGRRRAFRQPPGRSARYSNVGYLALGRIVSVAAGMPFERYVKRAVLDPIGMWRTGFRHHEEAPAATGYVSAALPAVPLLRAFLPGGIAGPRVDRYLSLNRFYVDGPAYGGLVGDVLDAGRFLRMHLGDGVVDGHRVLAPGTAARMRCVDQAGTPFEHGLGWFRRPGTGPSERVEHLGAGLGFWNVMRLYPDRGLGVVVMSNGTRNYDYEPLMSLLVEASCS